jgi:hypothetical protein
MGKKMSAAAVTNWVTPFANASSQRITVNASIPVARMEQWRREAIQKVIRYGTLAPNWDAHGSVAPSFAVRQSAIDLLLSVPSELLPSPRIVPVSGGGYHFEWSVGERELEISIDASCHIEALQVENGMPVEEAQPIEDVSALFNWILAR